MKIGDKVKIVGNSFKSLDEFYGGKAEVIKVDCNGSVAVKIEFDHPSDIDDLEWWYAPEDLELVNE